MFYNKYFFLYQNDTRFSFFCANALYSMRNFATMRYIVCEIFRRCFILCVGNCLFNRSGLDCKSSIIHHQVSRYIITSISIALFSNDNTIVNVINSTLTLCNIYLPPASSVFKVGLLTSNDVHFCYQGTYLASSF